MGILLHEGLSARSRVSRARGQRDEPCCIPLREWYAFDTGFVSFSRGWDPLRQGDHGPLWEHLVLEYIQAHVYESQIQYWRTADGREVDFVIRSGRDKVDAIECKWRRDQFDPAALRLFRSFYPKGTNYLICPITAPGYQKRISNMDIYVCNPAGWSKKATQPAK
ncbi:MAG TPA: DUF4143 domain-containing protein [Syntrophorhabdales bacterium]|nr:DUF4143 domain-containing protein [Syntrophorhabdales bacterium]